MSLRLYDTATASLRPFDPLRPREVGIYLCGATVQGEPHIGHLRSAIAFDQVWRWMRLGHDWNVTFVRNVTDIDDKILSKSKEAGRPWWSWALDHERAFSAAYDAVNVWRPTYEPRATGHIPEMVDLMQRLEARDHAYRALDGSSNVYFSVKSWKDYGSLTRQRPADMESDGESRGAGKRDPRDFALWKSVRPADDSGASWQTPFGRGRPGWHLECSAMIRKYLGESFDIHGGGLDLRFPHHENEQAQSRAAGWPFANFWLHNGWVTAGGEKMSKSLGNSMLVREVLKVARPIDLRYLLGASHYRSHIEYTPELLTDASTAMNRIERFLARASEGVAATPREAPVFGLMDEFLDVVSKDSALTSSTIAAYRSDLTSLVNWSAERNIRTSKELAARLESYYEYLVAVGYSDSTIRQRRSVADRFVSFAHRSSNRIETSGSHGRRAPLPGSFVDAMDDDLNVARALSVIHRLVRDGNAAVDSREGSVAAEMAEMVLSMCDVLGINPTDAGWGGVNDEVKSQDEEVLVRLVESLLNERQLAREVGDWRTADQIRGALARADIEVVDGAGKRTHWEIKRRGGTR